MNSGNSRHIEQIDKRIKALATEFRQLQRPKPTSWVQNAPPAENKLRWYRFEYTQATSNVNRGWAWSSSSGIRVDYTVVDGNEQVERRSSYSSSGKEIQIIEAGSPSAPNQSIFFKEASTWLVIQNVVAAVTSAGGGPSDLWDWEAIPNVAAASDTGYRSWLTNRKSFAAEFCSTLKAAAGSSGGYKFCWRGKADQLIIGGTGSTDFDVGSVKGFLVLLRIWTASDGAEGSGGVV